MNRKLKQLKDNLDEAREILEDAIYNEIDRVARQHKVDKIIFSTYGNAYYSNGENIGEIKEITELYYFFIDNVHSGGFEGIWTKEGWT